jgi:hypothetical protein
LLLQAQRLIMISKMVNSLVMGCLNWQNTPAILRHI